MYVNVIIEFFELSTRICFLKEEILCLKIISFSLFGRFSVLIAVKFRSDFSDMTMTKTDKYSYKQIVSSK